MKIQPNLRVKFGAGVRYRLSEVVGFDGGADAAAEERNEKGFGVVLLGVWGCVVRGLGLCC